MGLETGTYISDLNASNPASGDAKSQGDDHIRLVKSTILATFPNVTGAVTKTHTQINALAASGANADITSLSTITNLGNTSANHIAIRSDGRVGIGDTTPTYKLVVSNAGANGLEIDPVTGAGSGTTLSSYNRSGAAYTQMNLDAANFSLRIAGTEKVAMDSSGNLGVGGAPLSTTRLYSKGVSATSSDWSVYAENSAAHTFGVRNDGATFTGLAASSPYNLTTATAANMVVASDGFLYRFTSSIKYKEDVRDYSRGITTVMSLRPVFYKSKGSGDKARALEKELGKLPKVIVDGKEVKPDKLPANLPLPTGPDFAGFIAEEVHAIAPEFVQYAEDGSPDALSYGNMTALLCKAIQEQQALIVALTARVAKLEKS